MSGPSALGTLLVQRLDAVLGTTMAQQANLITGARPDAVTQAAQLARINAVQDATKTDVRHSVDRVAQHGDPRAAIRDTRLKTALDVSERQNDKGRNSSAPARLGGTARLILSLLSQYPDRAPVPSGRQPLWQQPVLPVSQQAQGQSGPGAGQAAGTGSAASAAGQAGDAQQTAQTLAARPGGATATGAAAAALALGTAGAPNSAVLARALSQAVSNSGMFYESHLADLAFGKRSPGQMAGEPQAMLGRQEAPDARAQAAQGDARQAAQAGSEDASAARQSAQAQSAAAPGLALSSGSLGPEAALLVRQQLEVLAHQIFAWQGEAWPGVPMDWEIHRRHGDEDDDDDSPQTWATRLRLDLPNLGEVEARLSLAGNALVMHLAAPESAELLQSHAAELRARYETNGLVLSNLSVNGEAGDPASPPSERTEDPEP